MISIVIPTYKRKENIFENIEHLAELDDQIPYELIFVDDGSDDGTDQVLKSACSQHAHVKAIVLKENAGQQNATLAGIRMAGYPYICTMDDDLSYDPKMIVALFHEMKKGYDVVYGVPMDKHQSVHRNLGTKLKEMVFFIALGKPFGVRLTSFRIMSKEVGKVLASDDTDKVYLSACILKHTRKIGNLPVQRLTKGGPSNYTVWKLVKLMGQIVVGYTWVRWLNVNRGRKKQYIIKEIYNETSGSGRK